MLKKVSISHKVDKHLKKEFRNYISWLEENYSFSLDLEIYVNEDDHIVNSVTGERALATFFFPFDKTDTGIIKVSTGDFKTTLKRNSTRDSILGTVNTLSHELQHYYQCVDDLEFDEEQADDGAVSLTWEYIESKDE